MRPAIFPRTLVLASAVLGAAVWLSGQKPAPPLPENNTGLPPRATPADYQFQVKAGNITIAAEFDEHSVPTPDGPLSTEDYVVVEAGIFGPPGAKLVLSPTQFSLRINGKKNPVPSSQYELVLKSLKDPTWEPPELAKTENKSKGGLTDGTSNTPDITQPTLPPIIHVPIELQRSWNKRAEKASLPEGERMLPEAGLLFFQHDGKTKSAELLYDGPAGKAKLTLK